MGEVKERDKSVCKCVEFMKVCVSVCKCVALCVINIVDQHGCRVTLTQRKRERAIVGGEEGKRRGKRDKRVYEGVCIRLWRYV